MFSRVKKNTKLNREVINDFNFWDLVDQLKKRMFCLIHVVVLIYFLKNRKEEMKENCYMSGVCLLACGWNCCPHLLHNIFLLLTYLTLIINPITVTEMKLHFFDVKPFFDQKICVTIIETMQLKVLPISIIIHRSVTCTDIVANSVPPEAAGNVDNFTILPHVQQNF